MEYYIFGPLACQRLSGVWEKILIMDEFENNSENPGLVSNSDFQTEIFDDDEAKQPTPFKIPKISSGDGHVGMSHSRWGYQGIL